MVCRFVVAFLVTALSANVAGGDRVVASTAWRLVNAKDVEVVWRIRSLQFFEDAECTKPVEAFPNATGDAFSTESADMTGAEYIFALRTMRGWESGDHCAAANCHVGFSWSNGATPEVRCLIMQQGEEDFHASQIMLQRQDASGKWVDVALWTDIPGGRTKLAVSCPAAPAIARARTSDCQGSDISKECTVQCDAGYGTVEPKLRCINGAWYAPECLKLGSMVRLVAQKPDLIKPYWVVLDAFLYSDPECSQAIELKGTPFSSGEFVIKYASYHPKNAWDNSEATSWASKEECTPGRCYLGYRFRQPLSSPPRCVRIEHPTGYQYQAKAVSVQWLGASGWEDIPDIVVRLMPEGHEEEL